MRETKSFAQRTISTCPRLAAALLERFHPEWKRFSSYLGSNFIGLEALRVSGQADIALTCQIGQAWDGFIIH